ncbi:MAG: phosphopantothenoylcysteine decarboxylase [bacterium]|nr:phosphopantothenoylcysteine decarboxylase [bacterium]
MAKILITAGGTKENIDPVRYIGNHSSGKMGIAVADEANDNGHDVSLILTFPIEKPYKVIVATSSDEMADAVKNEFPKVDILIMAAAVADFKAKKIEENKIKKTDKDTITVELVKTTDILKEVSKIKKENQIVIGFCAESENLLNNARKKLEEKKLDYIVANDISRKDIGFGSEYNEVTLMASDGTQIHIDKTTKNEIAKKILEICVK